LCFCVVLSCVGRDHCSELITCPRESGRVSQDFENLRCEAAKVLTRTVESVMLMMMKLLLLWVSFFSYTSGKTWALIAVTFRYYLPVVSKFFEHTNLYQ
jgi:hypothetical protein